MHSGAKFAMSGLIVKWLVYLFKQVFVLFLAVTPVGLIINKVFFMTLHPGLRLTVVFFDFMHAK
jgi:hypothetical protein